MSETSTPQKISFVIPSTPQAQQRHRHTTRGKFTMVYDPSAKAKKTILQQVRKFAPNPPLNCPLRMDITCYFERPKSHYRTGKFSSELRPNIPLYHTVKPDRDNIEKIIQDALNGVFYRDDSLICSGTTQKFYGEPRTEITITTL